MLTGQKSIVKISIPAKAVNKFKGIPVKIPMAFHRNRINNPKIYVES